MSAARAAAREGTVLRIHAQPGAREDAFAGLHDGRLKVKVRAAPEDGKANDAVVALVARAFGVPRSDVELLRGATSRRKDLLLRGVALARAEAVIGDLSASEDAT